MIRVLLADDQELARAGIRYLLETETDYKITGEVHQWEELTLRIQQDSPSILVLDYLDFSGFPPEGFQWLSERYPTLKLFILTADNRRERMLPVLQSGVLAFLTKDCSQREIVSAFHAVAEGQKFYCNSVLNVLTDTAQSKSTVDTPFSSRELQIIKFIAQDFSTQTIATKLNLSPHTINAHRKRILRKLGCENSGRARSPSSSPRAYQIG